MIKNGKEKTLIKNFLNNMPKIKSKKQAISLGEVMDKILDLQKQIDELKSRSNNRDIEEYKKLADKYKQPNNNLPRNFPPIKPISSPDYYPPIYYLNL